SEMGAEAAVRVDKEFAPGALNQEGLVVEQREEGVLGEARGYLIVGHQDQGGARLRKWALVLKRSDLTAVVIAVFPETARQAYPDSVVRAAFASITVRPDLSE